MLFGFTTEEDPVLAMLESADQQMILIEAEAEVEVEKGKHIPGRKTYFSGARVRRIDARLGTIFINGFLMRRIK